VLPAVPVATRIRLGFLQIEEKVALVVIMAEMVLRTGMSQAVSLEPVVAVVAGSSRVPLYTAGLMGHMVNVHRKLKATPMELPELVVQTVVASQVEMASELATGLLPSGIREGVQSYDE
jgi:hypothetical protein